MSTATNSKPRLRHILHIAYTGRMNGLGPRAGWVEVNWWRLHSEFIIISNTPVRLQHDSRLSDRFHVIFVSLINNRNVNAAGNTRLRPISVCWKVKSR